MNSSDIPSLVENNATKRHSSNSENDKQEENHGRNALNSKSSGVYHGFAYQLRWTAVIALETLEYPNHLSFKLFTECQEKAGKFDDVVWRSDGQKYNFLQTKHTLDALKCIEFKNLILSDNFSFIKYFISYRDVIKCNFDEVQVGHLIIATNLNLEEDLQEKLFDDCLKIGQLVPGIKVFDYLDAGGNINTIDFDDLASIFLECIFNNMSLDLNSDNSILMKCHSFLVSHILDVFPNCMRFSRGFINNSSTNEKVIEFRCHFLLKAKTMDLNQNSKNFNEPAFWERVEKFDKIVKIPPKRFFKTGVHKISKELMQVNELLENEYDLIKLAKWLADCVICEKEPSFDCESKQKCKKIVKVNPIQKEYQEFIENNIFDMKLKKIKESFINGSDLMGDSTLSGFRDTFFHEAIKIMRSKRDNLIFINFENTNLEQCANELVSHFTEESKITKLIKLDDNSELIKLYGTVLIHMESNRNNYKIGFNPYFWTNKNTQLDENIVTFRNKLIEELKHRRFITDEDEYQNFLLSYRFETFCYTTICDKLKKFKFSYEPSKSNVNNTIPTKLTPKLEFIQNEIQTYLNKLIFAVNFSNNHLDSIINETIEKRFDKHNIMNAAFRNKITQILEYPTNSDNQVNIHDFLGKLKNEINQLIVNGPTLLYTLKLDKFGFEFESNKIDEMKDKLEVFLETENQILCFKSSDCKLTALKLYQSLRLVREYQNGRNYILMKFRSIITLKDYVSSAFQISSLLVVVFDSETEQFYSEKVYFDQLLMLNVTGKIIFIMNENDLSFIEHINKNFQYVCHEDDSSTDLSSATTNSQTHLLEQTNLIFLGKSVAAKNILDNDSLKLVNANILSKIMNNELIYIGITPTDPNYEDIRPYFIPRKCYHGPPLDHYLDNLWKKAIDVLKIENDVAIISNPPGTGKSTTLSYIGDQSDHSLWYFRIDLLNYSHILKQWEEKVTKVTNDNAIHLLLLMLKFNSVNQIDSDLCNKLIKILIDNDNINSHNDFYHSDAMFNFEIQLFIKYYKNNNVRLLFDGFDEIAPTYTNIVVQLLETLRNTKFNCIRITTRSYNKIVKKLEKCLNIKSYSLLPLSTECSKKFLKRFFFHKLKIEISNQNNPKFDKFIDNFLENFKNLVHRGQTFVENPLLLKMVAMFFQSDFESSLHLDVINSIAIKNINIVELYEKFIRMTYDECQRKENLDYDNLKVKQMSSFKDKKDYKKFLKNHSKLALLVMFNDDQRAKLNIYDKECIELRRKISSNKDRTGIIINYDKCVKPIFIHYSFAEFFAARYIWTQFKQMTFQEFETNFFNFLRQNVSYSENEIRTFLFSFSYVKPLKNELEKFKIMIDYCLTCLNGKLDARNYEIFGTLKFAENMSKTKDDCMDYFKIVFSKFDNDNIFKMLTQASRSECIYFVEILLDLISIEKYNEHVQKMEWEETPFWFPVGLLKCSTANFKPSKLIYEKFHKTQTDLKDKKNRTFFNALLYNELNSYLLTLLIKEGVFPVNDFCAINNIWDFIKSNSLDPYLVQTLIDKYKFNNSAIPTVVYELASELKSKVKLQLPMNICILLEMMKNEDLQFPYFFTENIHSIKQLIKNSKIDLNMNINGVTPFFLLLYNFYYLFDIRKLVNFYENRYFKMLLERGACYNTYSEKLHISTRDMVVYKLNTIKVFQIYKDNRQGWFNDMLHLKLNEYYMEENAIYFKGFQIKKDCQKKQITLHPIFEKNFSKINQNLEKYLRDHINIVPNELQGILYFLSNGTTNLENIINDIKETLRSINFNFDQPLCDKSEENFEQINNIISKYGLDELLTFNTIRKTASKYRHRIENFTNHFESYFFHTNEIIHLMSFNIDTKVPNEMQEIHDFIKFSGFIFPTEFPIILESDFKIKLDKQSELLNLLDLIDSLFKAIDNNDEFELEKCLEEAIAVRSLKAAINAKNTKILTIFEYAQEMKNKKLSNLIKKFINDHQIDIINDSDNFEMTLNIYKADIDITKTISASEKLAFENMELSPTTYEIINSIPKPNYREQLNSTSSPEYGAAGTERTYILIDCGGYNFQYPAGYCITKSEGRLIDRTFEIAESIPFQTELTPNCQNLVFFEVNSN